jgi:hypothetical protein
VVAGDAFPGGVLLIGDWNSTAGFITDATYGALGNYYNVTIGTMMKLTFQIMHPGDSVINITNMDCFDWWLDEWTGDPPYDCSVYISELNTYTIVADSTTFYVQTLSNSTISGAPAFDIDVPGAKAEVYFNVTGVTGTTGYTNITIPKALLDIQSPWTVWLAVVDSTNVTASVVTNATHTFIYVPYTHSDHTVRIWGNKYIPEFPTVSLLFLMLLITAAMFIFVRKVHKRPWQTPLKR